MIETTENGVTQKELPYPERITEYFVCKNDWSWIGYFKHDKFYAQRDPETGIITLSCTKCGVTYTVTEKAIK